jgi:transmembrane sensor
MNHSPVPSSPAETDATATDWLLRSEAGLTEAERAEFEGWCAADPEHRAALDRSRQAWSVLDRPRLGGRGPEMIRALGARATRRRRRRVAAAAVALAAVVVFTLQWSPRRAAESWPPTAKLIVPEKRALADGSVVELRAGAELTVDYSGEFRRVALRTGEALFHVAKDPARPFVVSTGEVDVRAVGTAFAIAKASGEVDVVVTEGRVAVARTPVAMASAAVSAERPESTLVDAGRRMRMDLAAGAAAPVVATMSAAEIEARLDWRTPRVAFTDAALADAVAIMNQHSMLRLVIADSALAALPVNGVFRLGNSETMVRLLESNFHVQAERAGSTITLRKMR